MDEFHGSPASLVADVDCTAGGEDLCSKHEVQGYPTIKYGDPSDLKDYEGARDYDSLKKFIEENLGPSCGPEQLDLCKDAVRKKIISFMSMSIDRLEGKVHNAVEDIPLMKKVLAHKKGPSGIDEEEL